MVAARATTFLLSMVITSSSCSNYDGIKGEVWRLKKKKILTGRTLERQRQMNDNGVQISNCLFAITTN